MAKITKSRGRKPIAEDSEMMMAGNHPVNNSGGSIEIIVRDFNEDGSINRNYRLVANHKETIRIACFAAEMATAPESFLNGNYNFEKRSSWQSLRDLADKLEAEAKAVAQSARSFAKGGPWNGTDGQAY
jgi:hypothetical protein